MGVNGLWQVLQPCARPTNLNALNRKRLAVDASIWIYQFLKAVRDKEGNALRNSHVVGFFRRICKLLWVGILPVFVFDGGAPALKRQTILNRKSRREGRREDAVRTAGKLLAVQLQRAAEEEEAQRRKHKPDKRSSLEKGAVGWGLADEETKETLPDADKLVYVEELGMSQRERQQGRKFRREDAYHLPELSEGGIAAMGAGDDPRIMSVEELEEYARQFHDGEDINLYDFSKIDFDGEFFKSLPAADRYNILNAARLRSRLRMGLSKEQLEAMFPNRMDFSRFQIERVQERNNLTQRLMREQGMSGLDLTLGGGRRIAGEKDREYILVKNEGAEGGWALGVVSRSEGKDAGANKERPIDIDALQAAQQEREGEDSEDDENFEDVPIEGVNRLPKLSGRTQDSARGLATRRQQLYDDRQEAGTEPDVQDSLFVVQPTTKLDDGREQGVDTDEADDINRAIALSLQSQYGLSISDDETDSISYEEFPGEAPTWAQKAVEAPKPITTTTEGRMVAHIVNSRSNAAVPRTRIDDDVADSSARSDRGRDMDKNNESNSDSDSDSDMDLQTVLAASRRRINGEPRPDAAKVPNTKNLFDGPLPFPKLDWGSLFASPLVSGRKEARETRAEAEQSLKYQNLSPGKKLDYGPSTMVPEVRDHVDVVDGGDNVDNDDNDGMEGGFERELVSQDAEGPRPLPPWMVDDDTDIRDSIRKQQEVEHEINEEDRQAAMEEAARYRRQMRDEVVLIDSSDDDGDEVEAVQDPALAEQADPDFDPAKVGDASDRLFEIAVPIEKELLAASPQPLQKLEVAADMDVDMSPPHADMAMPHKEQQAEGFNSPSPAASSIDEFEDVEIPKEEAEQQAGGEVLTAPDDETGILSDDGIDYEDGWRETTGLITGRIGDGGVGIDNVGGSDDDSNDEFSDPEDAELFVQMAQEADEHARFASELNNKSKWENREAYEQELRALRSQQKKDRRDADEVTQVMIAECQSLLRLFGIPYITAPMEAEAQCAELVRLGLVDGIVTDDSDTFLFGGTRVYKNMFNNNKFVECYLDADLERELSLSRDQLISLAQLLGSDYAEGLPGIGPVTAVEILSEFPGTDGLAHFRAWWADVQAPPHQQAPRDTNAASTFQRKFRRSHATKLFLPPGFPSAAVVEAYIRPQVDASAEEFRWGVPDVEGLRRFLSSTIGWSRERTDEVLVPVIKDLNLREREGTQSNITRFFSGGAGGGAGVREGQALRLRLTGGSKRMANAVERLRARKAGVAGEGDGDGNDASVTNNEAPGPAEKSRKRKPTTGKRVRKKMGHVVPAEADGGAGARPEADVEAETGDMSQNGDSDGQAKDGERPDGEKGQRSKRARK